MTTPIIDVHAHFVPRSFPDLPEGVPSDGWPTMIPLPDGRARMMVNGTEFRIFEPTYWDVPARIEHMDQEGIALQVLSTLPELFSTWFDPKTTEAIVRHMNASIADAVKSAPGRLMGLGSLPLQDVALSVKMLDELEEQGLRGILCASNIEGVSIADPAFYPLFAQLERRGMVLFVHGYRPTGTERMLGGPMMGAIIGVPQESMAAVTSFIMTDIFRHFPKLKIGFVHGGGAFGAVLGRINHVWASFPALQERVATAPERYIQGFFFDTVTMSEPFLRYLIEVFGPDILMAGSDGPTPIGQLGLDDFVTRACGGDRAKADKILWKNAARYLGLSEVGGQKV